jgi:nucleotide-binding universal stress UspA family protein
MIKKILVVLDSSKPGLTAQQYAMDMATRYKASLSGLAILDTPWITAAQPEPLGGAAFKVHRDDVVLRQSQEHVEYLLAEFKKDAQTAKIEFQGVEAEGFPAVEIEKLSHEHDIIVIGKTTDFHFELDEDTDITVRHVARDNPRPLILVPENVPKTNRIMVAYDGSLQASRSLHMFLLLGLAKDHELHIVSSNKLIDKAVVVAKRAVRMCEAYGIKTTYHPLEMPGGSVAEHLLDKVKELDASMLVVGGFSHTLIHETLFGSCTKALMKNTTVPLFMFH